MTRMLLSDCVHCGFCLPTCPTYGPLWQEEMDSPRGRIYLMGGLVDGTIPLSPTTVEHFDRCLGCMACLTSCPSGVKYDRLIEQTRAHIEEHYERPFPDWVQRSLIFATVPHPWRLRLALALTPPRLPGRFRTFADAEAAVALVGAAAGGDAGAWGRGARASGCYSAASSASSSAT